MTRTTPSESRCWSSNASSVSVSSARTATIVNETEIANLNRAHQLRSRVRAALERLDEGSYGQCESCDGDISTARLKALPWASRCLSCEQEQERLMGARAKFEWRRPIELQA